MTFDKSRLHSRASLTDENFVYKLRNSGDFTSRTVDKNQSGGLDNPHTDACVDAQEHPGSGGAARQLCSCDFSEITDEGKRLALPVKPGDVVQTLRPLLLALRRLIPEDDARAKWYEKRDGGTLRTASRPSTVKAAFLRSSTASAPSSCSRTPSASDFASPLSRPVSWPSVKSDQSYAGKLRPCLVWRADPRSPNAEVFLMGTFHGTPYSDLPTVLRDFFLTVYTENGDDLRIDGHADRAHIHTSPCWTTPTTAWLIPLVLHIPFTELETRHESKVDIHGEKEKLCVFVNNNSMDNLDNYRDDAFERFSSILQDEQSRKRVARELLDQTYILDLFKDDFRSLHAGPSKADKASSWRSNKPSARGSFGAIIDGFKRVGTGARSTTSGEAAPLSPLRQATPTAYHPPKIVFPTRRSDIDDKPWRRVTSSPLAPPPPPPPPPPLAASSKGTHLKPPTAKPESRQSSGKRTSSFSSVRSALKNFTSRRSNTSTSSTRSQANTDDPSLSRGSLRDPGV